MPVTVQNTPTVNLSSTSIPNPLPVAVQNSPVVKLDASQNTVKSLQSGAWNVGITGEPVVSTPTQSKQVQLWTSNQTVSPGSTLSSSSISCAGYREARVWLVSNSYSEMEKIRVDIRFVAPNSGWALLGSGDFAPPATQIVPYANFVQLSTMALLIVPVMSDYMKIEVVNTKTSAIVITSNSWVYLVN